MKISFVIPMYNESSIVEDTVSAMYGAAEKLAADTGYDYEVLFSNDGSTDNCAALAEARIKELGADRFRVTGYEKNKGKGGAVRHAMLETTGDAVICTDCDLAYGVELFRSAAERFDSRINDNVTDLVIGSRNLSEDGYEGYTPLRRLMSKTYIKVLCIAAGFKLSDSQCGFKCYTGEAARRIFPLVETEGFAFDLEVILTAMDMGMSISEMPVKIVNHRESKVSVISDTLRMLGDLRRIKKRIKQRKKAAKKTESK